jgi:hypothetical protein
MTDNDKKLLQKFRAARELYEAARLAKQRSDDLLKNYTYALGDLRTLGDDGLRKLAFDAWEYFGKAEESALGRIAEEQLIESVAPDPHSIN